MTDAVTVCDATGRIRLANRASRQTYGVISVGEFNRADGAEERILLRYTTGEPVPPDERPLMRALRGETLQADYTMFHHGLGRDVHRRTSAAPVRDAAGDIIGAVAVETDITSLIELDRLKDEFFSMAAHELRTPLTAVKGYVQILAGQTTERNELSSRALATLREQSDRMERLINELLDVARIETSQLEMRRRQIDLVALLRQLCGEINRTAHRHQIVFECDAAEITGQWDRDRLAQVFGNLLTNAIKYSPEGGRVLVQVNQLEKPEPGVSVAVSDEGMGIAPEEIPRLFTRYGRVGQRGPYRQSGLGIGLYITREIVDAHGGQIRVTSEPGHGSTFTVTLPLQPRSRGEEIPSPA